MKKYFIILAVILHIVTCFSPHKYPLLRKYGFLPQFILAILIWLTPSLCAGQNIGINSTGAAPNASAGLDINYTDKGLLIPRLTDAQATTLAATAAEGLMIYNTTTKCFQIFNVTWQNIYCTCTAAPAAPTATAATSVTATSFDANWSASAGATTYYLDVSTVSNFATFLGIYNGLNVGNVLTYPVTGLTACTIYYYRVRANNSCGTSANSNTISVTATACETDDNYTVLKLHANGANGSTIFTDNSPITPHTPVAVGNAQISTAQAKFCQSGLFDGAGDYLSVPDNADWNLGGIFTIDLWVRFNSSPSGYPWFVGQYQDASNYWSLSYDNGTSGLDFQIISGGSAIVSFDKPWAPSNNIWYHIAVANNGGTWKLFVDGVQLGTDVSDADVVPDMTQPLLIGAGTAGTANYINGYIDELRISKGITRWTSDFTPPANPHCD